MVLRRRWRLTLVIIYDVAQVVAAAIVSLPHAHRIVREVNIAVVAKDWARGLATRDLGWRGRGRNAHFGIFVFSLLSMRTTRGWSE
jgi:hypothetical protein